MAVQAEDVEITENNEISSDQDHAEELSEESMEQLESADFALKLVNSVKSMNAGEITHYDLINSYSMADELKCLILHSNRLLLFES